MREFQGKSFIAIGALFVGFVGWSLYGAIWTVETYFFRMVHMAFIFGLAFLVYPIRKNAGRWTIWPDLLLAILGVATIVYACIDTDQFIRRTTVPEPMDLYLGIAAILLLLEISRRIVGNTFTLVVTGFLLYMYFGKFFPDAISHKGYDLDRIVGHMYMTLEGIFGVPLSVSASFVMLFVVYGTFMDVAGAGGFWLDLSLATMGRKSASAGRGAVITSALLGGPQGSGVATTMSVTPIMWPILKKAGYSPNMAAGLVATGGIGAVLSPPLMGAASFLIMQFLGISFWDVVVMVTVPTILYYVGTLFMVELEARKYRFAPPETEARTVRQVMLTKGYHLLSIIVLVALLVLWNKSPEYAALGAIATVVLTSFLSRDRTEWLTPRRIIVAMIEGAKNMLPVAVLLAAAGLIVGTFTLTGLGLKVSSLIMSVSGGSVLAALVLSLLASMLIGLSLPITATYIMTVVMVAPALVKLGVPEHVAHLLVFYFAVLSEVSPPVGLSPCAAAAVTGGNPFGSMMQAWKYSLPAFLVPFFFSTTPVGYSLLIVGGNWPDFLLATATSLCALLFISLGVIGHLRKAIPVVERALLILVAVAMVVFPIGWSIPGLAPAVAGGLMVVYHLRATRGSVLERGVKA
ncbi:TRAP transporter fused permease subunit [Candidatus Deferrimicrobium sp.]|uniref:TRAP transporter permease n=1 Tax=Candidatus Deferrimicrobium sp. TaxID=3060586 RepID=UPI002EDA73C2